MEVADEFILVQHLETRPSKMHIVKKQCMGPKIFCAQVNLPSYPVNFCLYYLLLVTVSREVIRVEPAAGRWQGWDLNTFKSPEACPVLTAIHWLLWRTEGRQWGSVQSEL